ncbi:MAG: 23S rRNA (guanosine(2251)-2'-O)-methyltransferase RlmB [Clostridia bacterium]|nr:23S rRNA (guanosine(2251)-2'-O)-methyltransferase RlmB [Clostridia bacterium]MBQ1375420.1 23S rRNA (guanosine(2251)-2'-O)-methyltransferase RlmB [Clostridia bacterium]MBQ1435454.1 23S rRNA (guanosine(2251)-2'-O)-methyltransferase RlmB [Clostridia bacterium]MBQ4248667.1 23S rRNA (guanosine(2251)-2'-O)-methyltransferase RlmB [Clostridia bacterium]
MKTRTTENDSDNSKWVVFGRNPVMELLKSGREVDKLFVQKGSREGSLMKILKLARERRIVISEAEKPKLDSLCQNGAHQGVVAFCAAKEYTEVSEMLRAAKEKGEDALLILCDEINDPYNLGAIIRTANAVGAHGVIIPKRRSVGLSGAVVKAAAGALEYVAVARVTNLSRTIDELKAAGVWIYGSDADGESIFEKKPITGPAALVIGSEGAGISQLIRKKCDCMLSIPMRGEINSLNASVAGGILMYELLRDRTVTNKE